MWKSKEEASLAWRECGGEEGTFGRAPDANFPSYLSSSSSFFFSCALWVDDDNDDSSRLEQIASSFRGWRDARAGGI